MTAASSIAFGIYSFTLPHTPPPAKGKPIDISSLLMVDALKLLKNPPFLVFAICPMLICIPLGYYYGQTSAYLGAAGFKQAAATMTLGQMSEIFFMILIPFFFRKLGVKLMLLVGMGCWVLRYVLFSFGAPEQLTWMLLLGVALHGICYDFFSGKGYPEGVNAELVTKAMTEWKFYWLFPAGMVAVIAVIFLLFFRDDIKPDEGDTNSPH